MVRQMTSRNYLLLTPGPLTTSRTVKEAMLFDSCTWDDDYNLGVVQTIRQQLVQLATPADGYTAVLLQGSGSYAVEAVLGSVIGEQGKVLIVSNGAYGARMIEMAQLMGIACHPYDCGEVSRPDAAAIEQILQNDPAITHIAMVHSETTTGMLNPIEEVAELAKRYNKRYIVDAMSSFGGIPLDIAALNIDYLISSANKCIQGVPGFADVIAREAELAACKGRSRSLSLDLYAQWRCMEDNHGKWRFTSPTHTVLAFAHNARNKTFVSKNRKEKEYILIRQSLSERQVKLFCIIFWSNPLIATVIAIPARNCFRLLWEERQSQSKIRA